MTGATSPLSQSEWVILAVVVALDWIVFHFMRARTLLARWAAANGYRILDRQWRVLRRGPFFLTTSRGQEVYRVTVEDRAGNLRRGYVRVGGFFLGMLSDRVDARWDPGPHDRPGFPVIMPHDPPGES